MFERYTEKARRAIFFARYEASQSGSPYIHTEHLLLGVMHEDPELARQVLKSVDAMAAVRKELEPGPRAEKTSSPVNLPLSHPSKRVLAYGAEEAEVLQSAAITPRHLLLGILREEDGAASKVLRRHGVLLNDVRQLPELPGEQPSAERKALHALVDRIPDDHLTQALEMLRKLAGDG